MRKYIFPVVLYMFFAHSCSIAYENDHLCGDNDKAQKLVKLIINDKTQQRLSLQCDQRLVTAATQKVKEMADTQFVFHGRANGRLRDQGVELPRYYGVGQANQVEALAGGQHSAENVWQEFKLSQSHAEHLLGLSDFYREQYLIGAAYLYAPETSHMHYWAVYVTKEDNASEKHLFFGPIPNKTSSGIIYH